MEFLKHYRSYCLILFGLVGAFQVSAQVSAGNYNTAEIGNTKWFYKVPPQLLPSRDIAIAEGRIVNEFKPAAGRFTPMGTVIRGSLDPLLFKPALARKFASALPGVGTAIAIAEIVEAIGAMATKNPDDTFSYSKPASTMNPALDYKVYEGGWARTSSAACEAYAKWAVVNRTGYYGPFNSYKIEFDNPRCYISYGYPNTTNRASTDDYYATRATEIPGAPVQSISSSDLADMVAAKSGWPATSKIAPFVSEILLTEPMSVTPEAVTGPASSPGKVETTTAPNGNVTTNTTTNNYTYGPNNVSVTNTTISNTYNPTTNTTTNNGTTTVAPGTPEPEKKTACEENPKAMGCAELDTPVLEIPKVSKDVTYSAETMFSGGACPPNKTITQALTGRPVVLSFTPTCDALANYVKPVIIAIALFMAYLIILPGRSD